MKIRENSLGIDIKTKILDMYHRADKNTGQTLSIFSNAFNGFSLVNGAEGAASVAYFVFFSMIPLLLLLVSIAGYLLADVDAISQILDILTEQFPFPRELIENNLRQLYAARNIGGIIGIIGLAWSASSSFISLARNINRAWRSARRLNFIQGRLLALAIIAILVLLIIIWYAITSIVNYIYSLDLPYLGEIKLQQTTFWRLSTGAIPWIIVFLSFLVLYKWVPNTRVRWRESLSGAAPATLAIFITTKVFTWFLSTGFVNFRLIYGSLGTILGFLTWVYITAFIAILGAHICSSFASIKRKKVNHNELSEDKELK